MAKIGKIFLDFEAGVAKFNEPIKRAKRNVEGFGGAAQKTKGKLAVMDGGVMNSVKNLKRLAIVAAGLMIFRQLGRVFGDAARALDDLAKTSSKLGVAVKDLQQLQVAAQITGIETKTLNMAMQRLVRRVSEAAMGTGEAVKALKELNLDAKELNKMPLAEKMAVIADAFRNLGSDADRVRLAMRLFDSEGVALVNTLNLSKEELDSINDTLIRFNYYLTHTQLEKVEKMNDSWLGMKILLTGIRNEFTAYIAPAMTFIINASIELFIKFKNVTGAFIEFEKNVAKTVIITVINAMGANLMRIVGIIQLATGAFQIMASTANAVFGKVFAVMDKLINGMVTKINGLVEKINKLPFIEFTPLIAPFQELRENMKDGVDDAAEYLMGQGIATLQKGMKTIMEAKPIDGETFFQENIVEPFEEFIALVNESGSIFAPMAEAIDGAGDSLGELGTQANKTGDLIASSLSRGIVQGEKLGDVFNNVVKQLVQNDLTSLIGNLLPGFGAGGGLFGAIRGIFGGPKAIGGSVNSGKSYMVGERGPELFSPNVGGRITPNNKLGGGMVVVNNHFDVSGSNQEIQEMIADSVSVSVDLAVARSRELKMRGALV
jgi:hypothetical protein